jgi:hypothetical protein
MSHKVILKPHSERNMALSVGPSAFSLSCMSVWFIHSFNPAAGSRLFPHSAKNLHHSENFSNPLAAGI